MSGDQVTVAAAVVGALVAVLTLVVMVRKSAQEQAAADERDRNRIRGEGFADGAKSRDDEIALLRSQRDDARQDRDQYRAERDEARRETRELRDRRDR